MPEIREADRPFVILAALVWAAALVLTGLDFLLGQARVYRFDGVVFAGLLLVVVGAVIRRWAKRSLGKNYAYLLTIKDGQVLVQDGIYRCVRHPAYSGTLLADIGTPLIFHSLIGSLVMCLLIPLFLYRIRIEEHMLVERFGDDYRQYMQKSKKLIPRIY